MAVGVFPLDVWRVILHFAFKEFHRTAYCGTNYYEGKYECRKEHGHVLEIYRMIDFLKLISMIHPSINRLLNSVITKHNTPRTYPVISIERLYPKRKSK